MSSQWRQQTVNGTASSSVGVGRAGRAVTAAMAPASRDLLADARTPGEPDGFLDRTLRPNVVAVAAPMRPATQPLWLPAGRRAALVASEDAQDGFPERPLKPNVVAVATPVVAVATPMRPATQPLWLPAGRRAALVASEDAQDGHS
jgi:hypothetical protein